MSYKVIIHDYIFFKEKITYNLVPSDSLRFRKWSKDFSFHSFDIIIATSNWVASLQISNAYLQYRKSRK